MGLDSSEGQVYLEDLGCLVVLVVDWADPVDLAGQGAGLAALVDSVDRGGMVAPVVQALQLAAVAQVHLSALEAVLVLVEVEALVWAVAVPPLGQEAPVLAVDLDRQERSSALGQAHLSAVAPAGLVQAYS